MRSGCCACSNTTSTLITRCFPFNTSSCLPVLRICKKYMSLGFRSYLEHRGLEVRATDGKGRGIFTTKAFKPGDILMETDAISYHYISTYTVCHYCLQSSERMNRCSACKFSKYCSPFCQKEGWTTHKFECKEILALQQHMDLTPEVILTYRTLKSYLDVRCCSDFHLTCCCRCLKSPRLR